MPGTVHAVVLDGLGWGADGTVWGGEILQGSYGGFVRCGHFRQVPLPGGEAANREPWRNLAAQLFTAFGVNYRANLVGTGLETRFAGHQAKLLDQMMQKGVNAPMTSSAGRLFDAVAAALDICPDKQGFEGEAAMQLEVLARASVAGKEGYPVEVTTSETVKLSFDKVWPALLGDLKSGVKHETISARFHQGLIDGLARSLSVAGARPSGKVVLSGGVFQNAFLRDGLTEKLETDGYTVLNHKSVPANDGGLALGQAVIAANLQAPSTFDD
jgi:hydrogenase maturation protein HypF